MKSRLMTISMILVALIAAGCGAKAPTPQAPAATEPPVQQVTSAPAPAANGTKYTVSTDRSTASYAVRERFLGKELDVTAIGKTSAFTGEMVLDGGVIKPSTVQIDLSTLTSDESRRDNQVLRALDTSTHRLAAFQITGAEGDPVLAEGKETSLKLHGKMTIKGTEKPIVFDGAAKLEGNTMTFTGQTTFAMTQFGVTPPSIGGFVSVTDEVTLHVTYVGTSK